MPPRTPLKSSREKARNGEVQDVSGNVVRQDANYFRLAVETSLSLTQYNFEVNRAAPGR